MEVLTGTMIIGILIGVVVVLAVWLFLVERRLRKLLSGKDAQSLEGVIRALGDDIRSLESFRDDTKETLSLSEPRLRRSIQGVETIRFNAFKGNGEGGNQSFAVALLSEDGDGVVISSIYSRDRVGVFAKPVKNFTSDFEMTEEEREAVSRAAKK